MFTFLVRLVRNTVEVRLTGGGFYFFEFLLDFLCSSVRIKGGPGGGGEEVLQGAEGNETKEKEGKYRSLDFSPSLSLSLPHLTTSEPPSPPPPPFTHSSHSSITASPPPKAESSPQQHHHSFYPTYEQFPPHPPPHQTQIPNSTTHYDGYFLHYFPQ